MEENPYAGILEVVRTDADARSASPWVIGTVAATAPLTVMLGGIPLSGADLLVNPQLLPHEETAALSELTGSLEGSPAAVSSPHLDVYKRQSPSWTTRTPTARSAWR